MCNPNILLQIVLWVYAERTYRLRTGQYKGKGPADPLTLLSARWSVPDYVTLYGNRVTQSDTG